MGTLLSSLFYSLLLLLFIIIVNVNGDCYMQNPRGSNDRLNEDGDRQNANRLFDSENNARGGYCWGPPMSFVEGSILPIEWTAQHGCGGDHVTCAEIIQYMCTDNKGPATQILRDGTTTTTIPDDINQYNTKNNDGSFLYGMQENYFYYQDCKNRERNRGLFIADQTPGNRARNTRQNPNGNRYGFECPEERDYYPYWHPAPWKDIAILTEKTENCAYYQAESQNVKPKNYCEVPDGTNPIPNNSNGCIAAGGTWKEEPAFNIPPPDCRVADFSRDNHLGNTGLGTETANYTWILPTSKQEPCILSGSCQCAIRIRYNITTNETTGLHGEFLDAFENTPVRNNPTFVVEGGELTLALNTAQYGRTFQDRSHMFYITERPDSIGEDTKIYNLNVRGKRGNIVQTYPATEYDFVPNRLKVVEGDIIHFQWTGCDTNPNGNAGEGIVKTDRSNIVQIKNLDSNIPLIATNATIEQNLFESEYLRNRMALIDQTNCLTLAQLKQKTNNVNQDPQNCGKLNAAPTPYFNGGLVRMNTSGEYYYMSTRNNNFSNRTQKGKIVVDPREGGTSVAAAIGITVAVLAVAAGVVGGLIFYGKRNPLSPVGRVVSRLPSPKLPTISMASRAAPPTAPRRAPLLHTN